MAETKINILICGLTSDSSRLFISLYHFLNNIGHQVTFFVPEYSGAVCLHNENILFISLRDIRTTSKANPCDQDLLLSSLQYDFKKIELDSRIIKRMKRKIILREARILYNGCKEYFSKNVVDLVIVWGGIKYHSSIPAMTAKEKNIPCIFIEKGLYPFTLQVDRKGVNASGILKNEFNKNVEELDIHPLSFYQSQLIKAWDCFQPVNSIKAKTKINYFAKNLAFEELFIKLYHKYFETRILKKYIYKYKWQITDPISNSESVKESDYIFIPFQVSDDSQLLIHSNWIDGNISLVEKIIKSLNKLNINSKIVIKEHPREFRNFNYKKILMNYDVHFSKAGTIDLISKSKIVITVNSTVGFEALVFCKPVIITGNAFYESIPLVIKSNNESELTKSIEKVLLTKYDFNESDVNHYASLVYNKLVMCNYVLPSESEIKNLWSKIIDLMFSDFVKSD